MPEEKRVYTPDQLYVITAKIKNLDYTNDLIGVTFTSSLSTAYQVIDLSFSLDPNDVIIEDIFGGEPIKLTITLNREQTYPGPSIDVELMYLTSTFALTQKDEMSAQTQKDRTTFNVKTLIRKPFKTMATLVNNVFIGERLQNIVSSLGNDAGAKSVEYDSYNRNQNVIDQVCVPPISFYKAIKEFNRKDADIFDGYLDQRFGLFSGTPGVFCQYDNTVYIKNLTGKLSQNQVFTVYQLSGGEGSKLIEKIFDDSDNEGTVFYTYDMVQTSYSGNTRFADIGSTVNQIVRPKDSLTSTLSFDLDTIAKSHSLFYSGRNKDLYIDPSTERSKYYNEDTGYENDSTQFQSRYGRMVSDLSSLSLNLERNLPVLNLIDVGECVKFKPTTVEYQDFEGKYILWSSVIKFIKQGPMWASTAQINLTRTNKKK